jgi:L-fuculose-phosphate aldolase
MTEDDARPALIETARRLAAVGLNVNAAGNLSVRVGEDVLVTPSGITPDRMGESDCVLLSSDGSRRRPDERVPTSEWRLHTELYRRRPDIGAIVHTHSPEATAAAVLATAVPAVHYVVARFGGSTLPCAPYATYGSAALAANVADTIGAGGMACLMANHGAIGVGRDLPSALALALDVEWLCGVYRRARSLGQPVVLDDAEIARVAERFATYGQPIDR